MLASAERKLLLSGMSKTEVEALKSSGAPQDGLYFPGNSGKAWIYMSVYEYELGLLKEGQAVLIDAVAFPGEVFKGKVTAITPVLNAESRSVRVRAEVDDKDGKLKPEMFVNAKISVDLGEKLAVPEEAVLDSGTRKIVYVVKDDRFAAREVTLGPKAGEFYEVLAGLNEGEEIVTSGNFLIDAESKLKGAL
jgi:Cu(I)/Ag(I) efflux system membrane fusion protein